MSHFIVINDSALGPVRLVSGNVEDAVGHPQMDGTAESIVADDLLPRILFFLLFLCLQIVPSCF